MKRNSKILYKNIYRNFYRIHQRINNELTIIRRHFYKFSKKQRNNSRFKLNLMNKQNLNDFKNAST